MKKSIVLMAVAIFLIFTGSTNAQTQTDHSALSAFLETEQPVEDARSYYASEELQIISYLTSIKNTVSGSINEWETEYAEIVSFLDNEIVWFEQHINTLLTMSAIDDLPAHMARARERYDSYPSSIETIEHATAISTLSQFQKELDETHGLLISRANTLQSMGHDMTAVFDVLDTAEEYIVLAADSIEDDTISADEKYERARAAITEGLLADRRAYDLMQSL